MKDCIFCQIVEGKAQSWKVFENEYAVAFFNRIPTNEYHTLVVPKSHYRDIFDAPENELREIMSAIKKVASLYKQKLGIENIQIINSSGAEAQQDVFHLHFHILPRHKGDGLNIQWPTDRGGVSGFDELLMNLNAKN
ncbi:MAG: HIT domain-containing protein [Rhizobiaceae bacterium]|nr:HIT domain-containing protein [Rhizobiaceae bacterium]